MNAFSPAKRGLDEIAARVGEVLGARILSEKMAFEELTITVAAGADRRCGHGSPR